MVATSDIDDKAQLEVYSLGAQTKSQALFSFNPKFLCNIIAH
jgi:hypothetical protein